MYTGLNHLHSALRYVILALLIITIIKAFIGWFGKKEYTAGDNKLSLFTFISAHTQLLIGLILYGMSDMISGMLTKMPEAMKDPIMRFWTVEHALSMVIAIAIITLGRIMSKKATTDTAKHRRIAVYYLLALVLIFSAIPWPFSAVARPWF